MKVSVEVTLLDVATSIQAEPGDQLMLMGTVVVGVQPHNASHLRPQGRSREEWDKLVLEAIGDKVETVKSICTALGIRQGDMQQRKAVSCAVQRLDKRKLILGKSQEGSSKKYFWERSAGEWEK